MIDRSTVVHALPATALVLGLFTYWFAVADRYIVFLYYHHMGPRYPDTSPFSDVTGSRYWMAGLVVGGAVLVLYTAAAWVCGRLNREYRPPAWRRVWLAAAGPLSIGLPAITMTANQPPLPLFNAMQVTLAALIGLALALMPARIAAARPAALIWLGGDGLALMSVLLFTPAFEDVPYWLANGSVWYLRMLVFGFAAGGGLLLLLTGLQVWLRAPVPSATEVFVAGLEVAYPGLTLLHHIGFTDGYYYITDQDNFFAGNIWLQLATWLLAAEVAWGITRLRAYLAARRAAVRAEIT
ncbi:MAG: hypothetical protein AB1801_06715 [Chloroflexota bacterium]